VVTARAIDSNVFGSESIWELRVWPLRQVEPSGLDIAPPAEQLEGRRVVLALRIAGRRHPRGYLKNTLSKLENHPE
jgi:hypothetical protein